MAAETQTSNDILQLVSFKIGKEEFGIDILKVQEINRMLNLTKVPNAPFYIDGVVNLRGRIIPIVNLRAKLGMERKEADRNSRIVVVELSGKTIGFLVDEVSEVLRIPESITEQPPAMVAGVDSSFIRAIGKLEDRLLILLDLEKVLSAEESNYLTSLTN
ncbi:chemotaxis protein CheW [Melioribacter roseus P3M-2]|uniref:Chemotaxis protein CheW n=1 Tax=Melioribacter roseus (strain DSM 23840 / JCM 17771 / VKM B-2668 / P3M-2) TaxID=1191523 RepID=I7A2B6_MELRP|nr:chemotaxis protein CheW [Melioribacter roseus]AFN74066.1 chemotaxis protein CheW [Melioribacter roseus P3M-2]